MTINYTEPTEMWTWWPEPETFLAYSMGFICVTLAFLVTYRVLKRRAEHAKENDRRQRCAHGYLKWKKCESCAQAAFPEKKKSGLMPGDIVVRPKPLPTPSQFDYRTRLAKLRKLEADAAHRRAEAKIVEQNASPRMEYDLKTDEYRKVPEGNHDTPAVTGKVSPENKYKSTADVLYGSESPPGAMSTEYSNEEARWCRSCKGVRPHLVVKIRDEYNGTGTHRQTCHACNTEESAPLTG